MIKIVALDSWVFGYFPLDDDIRVQVFAGEGFGYVIKFACDYVEYLSYRLLLYVFPFFLAGLFLH